MDWPHAPGRALCNHGNSSAGRLDQSLLVHEGVAQTSLSPSSLPGHPATAPCSVVGVWHQVSSTLWAGSLQAVLWAAPCPGQQGPERGLGLKGHELSWCISAELGLQEPINQGLLDIHTNSLWKVWEIPWHLVPLVLDSGPQLQPDTEVYRRNYGAA